MGCCNSDKYSSSLDSGHIGIFKGKLAGVALTPTNKILKTSTNIQAKK
jgi:hypothetical protein